ncbi:MAG: M28 family peptidase [Thermoplasmatota archaeon]
MKVRTGALVVSVILLAGCLQPGTGTGGGSQPLPTPKTLQGAAPNATRLYGLVRDQVLYANGTPRYRIPGTAGDAEVGSWIGTTLRNESNGTIHVTDQNFSAVYRCKGAVPMTNVVGTLPGSTNRTVILMAHYDTRPVADNDPNPANHGKPIEGANDGGSGVAVLLEMARLLALKPRNLTYIFLFVDGEDGGQGQNETTAQACNADWALGSAYYARSMSGGEVNRTEALVLFDLVGDVNLSLMREDSSFGGPGQWIQNRIWAIGAGLGYGSVFSNSTSYAIEDDHTPFLNRGIPSLDIIDLRPPYFENTLQGMQADPFPPTHHKLTDDLAHISPTSLVIVAQASWLWLEENDRVPK